MQTTSRFNLNAPELTDEADITKISENMTTIDAEMAGLSKANTFTDVNDFTAGLNGELTGNAATATKLQTARTINGVSFDGTQNINIAINHGRTEPTSITSLLDIDAMNTACNTNVMNINNSTYGVVAYGGDAPGTHSDGVEFKKGDLILKESLYDHANNKYKFDEIIFVMCTDDGTKPSFHTWKSWELAECLNRYKRINITKETDLIWHVNTSNTVLAQIRNSTPFAEDDGLARFLTEGSSDEQNCGLIDILGVKY